MGKKEGGCHLGLGHHPPKVWDPKRDRRPPPTPLRPLPFRPLSEDSTFLALKTKAHMCIIHTVMGRGLRQGARGAVGD